MTDAYARDAMGGDGGLSDAARARLPQALSRHPGLFALLAELDGQPVGHALCVLGFSSFAAAPTCNLHDLSVLPSARGQGLGRQLLREVERQARERGCARLTLEVREDNARALGLYQEQGYVHAGLGGASYRLMMKPL